MQRWYEFSGRPFWNPQSGFAGGMTMGAILYIVAVIFWALLASGAIQLFGH